MKKRLIISVLAAILLLSVLTPAAYATETESVSTAKSGTCGDGITWALEDYTLTISGSGEMEDGCPWENWMTKVEHVVLTGGITKIGAEAFDGFLRLETVDFGDSLVEIGTKAFRGCNDLSVIHLPATFRTFGAEAFRDCTDLVYVYCDGPMPRFNDSCLWTGNYISVFYPTNNPWPAEAVNSLVHNFGGRLGIMMGNYDPDTVAALEGTEETEETEPEETEAEETVPETTEAVAVAAVEATAATEAPTEAPTEVPTEAPTVPTTEPPTQPTETTVPETEPTTIPTTVAVTEGATEAPFDLTEATAPAQEEEETVGSSWIGIVMIAGVLTFLIAGAMIFRSTKRGRY